MKVINHENLQSFIEENMNRQKICNNYIFDIFFNEILKINQTTCFIELKINDSYELTLRSENNRSIMITFNLWHSQINIFLGREWLHYADDISIKSNADLVEFRNQLSILFKSNIEEELLYNNDKLKKYRYKFYKQSKCIKEYKNHLFNLYVCTCKKVNIVKNKYNPWIL